MTLAAGPVWTFWIAVPLAASGVLLLLLTVVGYLKNVSAPRFPRDGE